MANISPETDTRHQVLNWAVAGLMAAFGLAAGAFLQMLVGASGGRPGSYALFALIVVLVLELLFVSRKERRLRHIHESLVAHLHHAVADLTTEVNGRGRRHLSQAARSRLNDTRRLADELASGAADPAGEARTVDRVRRAYLDVLQAVARPLGGEDTYDAIHGEEVAKVAAAVAQEMKIPPAAIRDIAQYGRLFDYGKLAVAARILHKAEPLTDREWEMARQHVELGEAILRPLDPGENVLAMVRHHHERWDGKGYPDGLQGTQIPMAARILAVADAYHALVSHRPYARARSSQEALSEIQAHAGTQFDPDVVRALAAALAIAAPTPASA